MPVLESTFAMCATVYPLACMALIWGTPNGPKPRCERSTLASSTMTPSSIRLRRSSTSSQPSPEAPCAAKTLRTMSPPSLCSPASRRCTRKPSTCSPRSNCRQRPQSRFVGFLRDYGLIPLVDGRNFRLVAKLMARVLELEARLGQNSSNSNQPPSKDTPEQKRDRDKSPPSGRKRGGQPGHKPQQREMLPPEQVSRIEDHPPHECGQCGSSLLVVADPDPLRHQVIDLP